MSCVHLDFGDVCGVFQNGPFRSIQPEAVRALDGDVGINVSLLYSISAGRVLKRNMKKSSRMNMRVGISRIHRFV